MRWVWLYASQTLEARSRPADFLFSEVGNMYEGADYITSNANIVEKGRDSKLN